MPRDMCIESVYGSVECGTQREGGALINLGASSGSSKRIYRELPSLDVDSEIPTAVPDGADRESTRLQTSGPRNWKIQLPNCGLRPRLAIEQGNLYTHPSAAAIATSKLGTPESDGKLRLYRHSHSVQSFTLADGLVSIFCRSPQMPNPVPTSVGPVLVKDKLGGGNTTEHCLLRSGTTLMYGRPTVRWAQKVPIAEYKKPVSYRSLKTTLYLTT